MTEESPKKDGYSTVRLKDELVKKIDDMVETDIAKEHGITSRADFVTQAVLKALDNFKPRFEHQNMIEGTVRIIDYQMRRTAELDFRENGSIYCNVCRALDCEHIRYALEQTDIQKALKEREWKCKRD